MTWSVRTSARIAGVGITMVVALMAVAGTALADGSPNISATVGSNTVLYGNHVKVDVTASNPSTEPYGYNLSFRVVLPAGVDYVGGAAFGGTAIAPTIVHDQPATGQTTLIFSNVSDLSPGATFKFDDGLTLSYDTSVYDAGDQFDVQAQAFVNSDARYVPKFTAAGAPISGPTSSTGSAGTDPLNPIVGTQKLVPLQIEKSEPSPEGEIMRGVHDDQTTYTLTVRNNTVHQTTGTTVEDYLPAGLEFLGCSGAADNTTDAPTNPGSADEYTGSGPIVTPAIPADPPTFTCVDPVSIDTVLTDPDGAGPLPTAVYTHVVWPATTLAAGEVREYKYKAAIPIRENTLDWNGTGAGNGTAPSPASLKQGTNLDNNSGPQTTDEQQLTNYATAHGDYQGPNPFPAVADSHLTRTAEDWRVLKSASSDELDQGAITKWTLTFTTSEYSYLEDGEVTDTVPNGLCPISSTTNYAQAGEPGRSECDPVAGKDPTAPYTSVTENADGTWTVHWDATDFEDVSHTDVNQTFTLDFYTATRTHYYDNFLPTTPILTRDAVKNTVHTDGKVFPRCTPPPAGATPDCTTPGATISHDVPAGSTIIDDSEAGQVAAEPTISKQVAAAGPDCVTATYVNTVPHYHPGDKICWKVRVDFPGALDTDPQAIRDFLPADTTYLPGSEQALDPPDGANSVTSTFDPSNAGTDGELDWTITGLSGNTVPAGSLVFEHVFASTALPIGTPRQGDLTDNLFKFSSSNTPGTTVPQRADADYALDVPDVKLLKGVAQVERPHGTVVAGPFGVNHDHVAVEAGDEVTYRVDVSNDGLQDAEHTKVWDVLPTNITCADLLIGSISDGGTCVTSLGGDHIEWTGLSIPQATTDRELTYTITIPSDVGPGLTFDNHAGVVGFDGITNTGTNFPYVPANNIDPSAPTPNAPAADDHSNVFTAGAGMAKTSTTTVTETPGNDANTQATIGEEIAYTVTATVPEGTTLGGTAQLTDTVDGGALPARQTYVTGSASATLNGVALPGTFTLDTSGATPKVVFPAGYTNAPGSGDDTVVLTFHMLVANVAANTRTASSLTNKANLSWTDPDNGPQSKDSNQTSTSIVEPLISQTKQDDRNPAAVHPGDIVTYTVKTSNSNATRVSRAHDVQVMDCVPVGLTPVGAGDAPLADGAAIPETPTATYHTPAAGTCPAGSVGDITMTVATIAPGANSSLVYRAKVDDPATGGSALKNTAVATTASLDNTHPGRRTTGTGYSATSNDTLHIATATVAKSVDPATATIGTPVTYTVTATIPANINLYDVTVVDTLPDSVDFDGYGAITCVSGCPFVNAVNTYTLTADPIPPGTTRVGWDLGDIPALTTPQVVTFKVNAHVRDTHRADTSTKVLAGQTAVNSVVIESDQTNKGPYVPGPVPSGPFDDTSTPATASTLIQEPKVGIDKKVKVGAGSFVDGPTTSHLGDSYTYQLAVTNTGTSPAYDVEVNDLPDAVLTNVQNVAQAGVTVVQPWTSGDHHMKWKIAGPIPVGGTVTFTYTADLVPVGSLTANPQSIDNTASIPHYWGVPSADRLPGVTYRDYTDGGSDAVHVELDYPALTIDKTPDGGLTVAGEDSFFTIKVKNTGSATATNLDVVDTLPAGLTYVPPAIAVPTPATPAIAFTTTSITPSSGVGPATIHWKVDQLAAGQTVTITVPVHVAPTVAGGTTLTNGSSATADHLPTPVTDNGSLLVATSTDMKVTKTGAATYTAGTHYTWHLRVQNLGPSQAESVSVSDPLPAGTSFVSADAPCANVAGTVTCALGTTQPGFDHTYDVTVAVDPGATTNPLDNTATVSTTTPDSDSGNDHSTFGPTPSPDADVTIAKSASPTEILQNQQSTFTVTASNVGPSTARGVQVTDPIPAGLQFVSVDDPACSEAAGTVTCNVGDLAPGATFPFHVTVKGIANGSYTNVATVTTTTPQTGPEPDSASAGLIVGPVADLSVTKTGPGTVAAGGQVSWDIAITNQGPSDATGVKVVDPLPAGTVFVSADPGCTDTARTVTCLVGNLANGDTVHRTITVTVPPALGSSTVVNNATASGDQADDDPTDDTGTSTVQVGPSTDLGVVKTGPATANANGAIAWTIVATNHGPSPATGVVVTDTVPDGVSITGATSAQGSCSIAGQTVTCALGSLANGSATQIQLTGKVAATLEGHSIANTAHVAGEEPDPNPPNDDSTSVTKVGPPAPTDFDLTIRKTVLNGVAPHLGVGFAYAVDVSNSGPATAHDVTVVDTVPTSLRVRSATVPGGRCTVKGQLVTCIVGTLASGATVRETLRVLPVATGRVRNTASVHASVTDHDPTNDTARVTTTVTAPRTTLAVRKTANVSATLAGQTVRYRIVVTDTGSSAASGVKVCDTLPRGLTFVSADQAKIRGRTACWTVAYLPAHRSRGFTVAVRVGRTAKLGKVTNVATARAGNASARTARARILVMKRRPAFTG
jgi:uncharacterized repeat protein (TIGR01451 family)/fimbrial isopeptide formation D2 family protein